MSDHVRIDPSRFVPVGRVSERFQSYNIEMAEITGGTFWRPYTDDQVRGVEPVTFASESSGGDGEGSAAFAHVGSLTAPVDPVDLSGARVRTLARALGPVHVRVSGSWASHTWFDVTGDAESSAPDGYHAVLRRHQWDGLIDFARSVGADLVTSMANTAGAHLADGSWNPANSRAFLTYTLEHGLNVAGAEFMNEPDLATLHGAPAGYTAADYRRDVAIFVRTLRETAPEALFVGPGAAMARMPGAAPFPHLPIDELMTGPAGSPDVFSYHFYNGLSERGGGLHHTPADQVLTEEYLARTEKALAGFATVRDDHAPGAPMWLTETADAAYGGSTWAPTWLDVPRYVDQLGRLARNGVECVMHNTLCASDYGMLDGRTHSPRAKYWAAWMWATFMGAEVFDTGVPMREGLHVYAHDRRGGAGHAMVLINNSRTESTHVDLTSRATVHVLTGPELRGLEVHCNGRPLRMVDDHTMPEPVCVEVEGVLDLPPVSVTFVTFEFDQ